MKMIRSTSKVTFVFWLVTGMFYSGCGELRGVHTKEFVEFDPPLLVMPTSREQAILAKLKDRPDVAKAFESLQEQADNALSRNPSQITTISYEGYLSNHPLRIRTVQHLQDMIALRALIWATIVTGDETYRSQAKAFLLAWARSYRPTGNEVNENKLDSCFFAYYVLKDFLREAERKEVAEWFETIGTLHQKLWPIKASGNRAAKRIKLVLLASVVLDRPQWQQWAKEKMSLLIESPLNTDGTSDDLKNRDAMHYHNSCLEAMLEVALIGRLVGIDFYSLKTRNGASTKRSIHYMLPYIRGKKIHKEWIHTKAALDRQRWKAGDPYYRPGKSWDPAEAYGTLLLAFVFDPSIAQITESLSDKAKEANAWLEVLTRVTRPIQNIH